MPRRPRRATGGLVYHVLNRAIGRTTLFETPRDYLAFERIIGQAHHRVPMRTLAFCIMPNHWHLVLWPRADGDLSEFMRWLTLTHTQRRHAHRDTAGTGPLYQGRFKSLPVETDAHFLTVCRYVERNPLRANLVERAEDWRWSSLWWRVQSKVDDPTFLNEWPVPKPPEWPEVVSQPQNEAELAALRVCIARGRPYGPTPWVQRIADRLGLTSAFRPRGRPKRGRESF